MDRKLKPVGPDKDGERRLACGLEMLKKSSFVLMHKLLEVYKIMVREGDV